MNLSARPYFDEKSEPCLEQSVIVVADVLGYSASIREAFKNGQEQELLKSIHNALNIALKNISDPSGTKWFTKLFSDNIVVGYRFIGTGDGAFEFPQACHSIGHFQREMAVEGFFIRGGIALGQIHMSDNLIYGRIIEELQQAEKRSLYPRIVLLDSTISHLKTRSPRVDQDSLLMDILWNDDCDGSKFINYLYPLGTLKDNNRCNEVLKHKTYIESGLRNYESDGRIIQKYRWLAKYHNRFCYNSRFYNTSRYLVEAKDQV